MALPAPGPLDICGHPNAITKPTVLYIEDNQANIYLVEQILARRSFVELLTATSGADGLQAARDARPDLILLDRGLPDMQGNEVLVRLKASSATATIPVVVFSGDTGLALIAETLALGAVDYLPKPVDIAEFLKIIDRFCPAPQ